jgi:predicted secreted protein
MSDYGSTPPPPPPLPPPFPYGAAGAQSYPPANYLVWAILSTVLCCLPLGIASIVFSTQVNSKWAMGDVAGAQAASGKAKKFAIWAVVAGLIVAVLYGIAIAVGIANINLNTSTNSSGF